MDRLLEWLGKLPTTQARVAITLVLCMGTGIKVLAAKDWDPALDWLGFLAAMSGLDAAQFYAKRITHTADETSRRKAERMARLALR